eukprot:CAMPEP_0113849750 /NCGR_PEP_ID=MMETSP0372-20130328/3364_1 /TAXON_ID=340204 /ORGANISM="Lankesteria abbotti" /LENGTH=78 /DNA_ID=CAMNT_0000819695 /DNA_START=517 /DNA_END=753 /DNA_ORIENTATION=+ /assembly_acc=CAM_ASM_000359
MHMKPLPKLSFNSNEGPCDACSISPDWLLPTLEGFEDDIVETVWYVKAFEHQSVELSFYPYPDAPRAMGRTHDKSSGC